MVDNKTAKAKEKAKQAEEAKEANLANPNLPLTKEKYEAEAARRREERRIAETPPPPVPGNPSGQPATDKRGNEPESEANQKPASEVDSLNKAPHNPPYQGESAWHKQASDNINEGQDHKNAPTPQVSGHNMRQVPVGSAEEASPRSKKENDEIEAENARQSNLHLNPDGTKNVLVQKTANEVETVVHVAEAQKVASTKKGALLPVRLFKGYYPKDGSGKVEAGQIAELPAEEAREVVKSGVGERGDAF